MDRGRMVGGSGSHNGIKWLRGSPYDWDNFANLTGDPSYKYSNALKYFKRIENYVGPLLNESDRACKL